MLWIIPMAGKGERTQALGEFKPFIKVLGKPILEWLLTSVKNNINANDRIVYTTTQYFNDKYNLDVEIKSILERLNIACEFKIETAPSTPLGPAKSVYLASEWMDEEPCTVLNSDQFIIFNMPEIEANSCILVVNTDFGSSKSYLKLDGNTTIGLVEKENVSCISSCGVYTVSRGLDLRTSLEDLFEKDIKVKGEFFVAPALNNLAHMSYNYKPVSVKVRFDLGTTQTIKEFEEIMQSTFHQILK